MKSGVVFVPSEKNKADALTRVKKAWIGVPEAEGDENELCCVGVPSIEELHQMRHMGVDRTRRVDPVVTREKVKQVVRQCDRCRVIDPAPAVHEPGRVRVESDWRSLSVDVTHYRHQLHLPMADLGPGRVAIGRELC